MSKKLLSVMLALVMVLSVFSVAAFAVNVEFENPDAEEAYTQMWYLETTNTPDANGDYTVDVYLEANYAVGAISFNVAAEGATLKNADASDFIYDAEGYNPEVEVNKSAGNVFIIPKPVNAAAEGLNLESATLIATLTYTLTAETATITLNNDAKTIDNDGNLIAARLGDGVLASNTMYYGQWVVDAEYADVALGDPISSVTLGAESAADPVLTGVNGGVVDTENGYVYGVVAGDPIDDNYFTVENGTFEMVANDAGYTNGTGATLVVKDAAGNEFATYTLVIFGDINGDGEITSTDYTFVKNATFGGAIDTEAGAFAADINGDGEITSTDYTFVKNATFGGDITVNPFAA